MVLQPRPELLRMASALALVVVRVLRLGLGLGLEPEELVLAALAPAVHEQIGRRTGLRPSELREGLEPVSMAGRRLHR